MTTSTTLNEAFEPEKEEGTQPFELLPKGKYKAEITNATVAPTKKGNAQMMKLTWTVTEGDFENRLLFQSLIIKHDDSEDAQRFGRQKFKDICVACGITEPVTDLDVLRWKPCIVHVGIESDKTGQYEDKNKVTRVTPVVPSWNGSKPATAAKPAANILKEATTTPKSFEAKKDDMNDEIPW